MVYVSADTWEDKSKELISRFALESPNGNDPIPLRGVNLQNFIGFMFNLPMKDFEAEYSWVQKDIYEGKTSFYGPEELETIKETIRIMYDKKEYIDHFYCFVRVIPVLHYHDENIDCLVVLEYQVQYLHENKKYLDYMGRVYSSFFDFEIKNKIPKGQICYPKDGEYTWNSTTVECCVWAILDSAQDDFDATISKIGLIAGIFGMCATGGLALPFLAVGATSAIYGASRQVDKLVDREAHKQTVNPFIDKEARAAWIGLSTNLFTFSAIGTGLAIKLGKKGAKYATAAKVMNTCCTIAKAADGINSAVNYLQDWDALKMNDRMMLLSSLCFWRSSAISFKDMKKVVENNQYVAIAQKETNYIASPMVFKGLKSIRGLLDYLADINLPVSVNIDQTTITFCEYSFPTCSIMRINPEYIHLMVDFFSNIPIVARATIESFRKKLQNDFDLVKAIAAAVSETDVAETINLLIELVDYFQNLGKLCSLTVRDGVLIIGKNNKFSIVTAARTLIKLDLSLTKALISLTVEDCDHLNNLRYIFKNDVKLLGWIHASKCGADTMLTNLIAAMKNGLFVDVKVHGLVKDSNKVSTDCGIFDVEKFAQMSTSGERIQKYYQHLRKVVPAAQIAAYSSEEKLPDYVQKVAFSLPSMFENKSSQSLKNCQEFADHMEAKNFTEFYHFMYFAINKIDDQMKTMSEREANENVFTCDFSILKKKFIWCKEKADKCGLVGVVAVDEIVALAADNKLKFGSLETAAVHVGKDKSLVVDKMARYNRLIATGLENHECFRVYRYGDGGVDTVQIDHKLFRTSLVISPEKEIYIDSFIVKNQLKSRSVTAGPKPGVIHFHNLKNLKIRKNLEKL